jgi:SPOR domain
MSSNDSDSPAGPGRKRMLPSVSDVVNELTKTVQADPSVLFKAARQVVAEELNKVKQGFESAPIDVLVKRARRSLNPFESQSKEEAAPPGAPHPVDPPMNPPPAQGSVPVTLLQERTRPQPQGAPLGAPPAVPLAAQAAKRPAKPDLSAPADAPGVAEDPFRVATAADLGWDKSGALLPVPAAGHTNAPAAEVPFEWRTETAAPKPVERRPEQVDLALDREEPSYEQAPAREAEPERGSSFEESEDREEPEDPAEPAEPLRSRPQPEPGAGRAWLLSAVAILALAGVAFALYQFFWKPRFGNKEAPVAVTAPIARARLAEPPPAPAPAPAVAVSAPVAATPDAPPPQQILPATKPAPAAERKGAASATALASAAPAMPQARAATIATKDWAGKAPMFVIHFSSYRDRPTTEKEAARIGTALGKTGHAVEVDLGEKGIWYRVLIGDFATLEEALEFRRELEAKKTPNMGFVYRVAEKK